MSVITFPTIKVGGNVTQEVIRHTPHPPSKSTLKKPSRNNRQFQGRSTSSEYKYDNVSSPESLPKGRADSIIDTTRYRNSYKHNLCLDMLQDGFHRAFCELFALLSNQKEMCLKNEREFSDMNIVLLEDDPEKLDTLQEHLIAAETAKRRGRSDHVYESQLSLAKYFSASTDLWLADYFHQKCLETSLLIVGDNGQKEAEANFNLGMSAEKKLDFFTAVDYMEISHGLSQGKDWEDSNGIKFHQASSDGLQRLYTAIAEKIEETDADQALEYLQKAFQMAQEAGSEKQVGETGFRLGKAYEEYGDSDAAIKLFADYLEICNTLCDDNGKAQACRALADAYHSYVSLIITARFKSLSICILFATPARGL